MVHFNSAHTSLRVAFALRVERCSPKKEASSGSKIFSLLGSWIRRGQSQSYCRAALAVSDAVREEVARGVCFCAEPRTVLPRWPVFLLSVGDAKRAEPTATANPANAGWLS